MYAVGRIGSYISRGVYTVSGPFHPFGGAVDIIVVQQEDGSFKSSPWYVRFGKFQGVLKSKEKVVDISINGNKADFHMHLDNNGQAYFLREMIVEDEDSLLSSSSGEDTDGKPSYRRTNSDTQVGVSNGTTGASTNSQRSQMFGFVFGKNSVTENRCQEDGAGVLRTESLDRAEMAADLLDVKWSTSLVSRRYKEENAKQFSPPESSDGEFKDLDHNDMQSKGDSDSSPSGFQEGERFVEESSGAMSYSVTEGVTTTSTLSLSSSGGHDELNSKMSRKIDKLVETLSHPAENAERFISEIAGPIQKVLDTAELEACPGKKLGKEQNFDEKNVGLPEQNGTNGVQSFLYCETSESSIIRLDGPGQGANGTLKLSSVKCEVCIHAKTEDETTETLSEVKSQPEATLSLAEEHVKKILKDKNCCNLVNVAKILENGCALSNSIKNCTSPKTHSKMVVNNLDKEVDSWSTISQNQEEKKIMEKNTSELLSSLESAGNQQDIGGSAFTNAICISSSESLEEEELLFGEPDDLKLSEYKIPTPDHMGKKRRPPLAPRKIEEVHESVQEDVSNDFGESRPTLKSISSEIDIPRHFTGEEAERMVHSLPNLWSHDDNSSRDDLLRPLENSPDKISKTSKWMLIREDLSSCIKLQEGSEYQLPSGELQNVHANSAAGGSWRFWPFALKKSRSIKAAQTVLDHKTSTAENYMGSASSIDGQKDSPKRKINKNIIRANMPTSDQLASLDLKEGKNIVTFTFSTPVLGTQEVDAQIYLWGWDTRIVISDVDGTITKSDVLGQFMPLVGMDWSQTGVTHLFSAIKENGYQLIFLSARAISQAYHTRQFLLNLKQDGKALPHGPVVISPDGLFPSLFREVIRRAPHEFKIACLEDIKALFPADRNPFYAGFGNRDTDEISYLKVGIPRGKIFIINPKGEVAVNRGVYTKSYTSLHALVHDMFPPMSSSEQEDFNSWNFWKLPTPGIDI